MLIFDFQDYWSIPPFGALDLWLSVCMYASVIIFFTNLGFYASHILITMRWWDIADSWDAPWGPSKFSKITSTYGLFISPCPKKKQKRNWPNTNEKTIYWMQDALYTTFVNEPQFHDNKYWVHRNDVCRTSRKTNGVPLFGSFVSLNDFRICICTMQLE